MAKGLGGGAANDGGINFQRAVAGLMAVHLLARRPLHQSLGLTNQVSPATLTYNGQTKVDDIELICPEGPVFIQCKANPSLKDWKAFGTAALHLTSQNSTAQVVLVVDHNKVSPWVRAIPRLLRRYRQGGANDTVLVSWSNKDQGHWSRFAKTWPLGTNPDFVRIAVATMDFGGPSMETALALTEANLDHGDARLVWDSLQVALSGGLSGQATWTSKQLRDYLFDRSFSVRPPQEARRDAGRLLSFCAKQRGLIERRQYLVQGNLRHTVPRKVTPDVVTACLSKRLVMVVGQPGAGKSGVLAATLSELESRQRPVYAFSLDDPAIEAAGGIGIAASLDAPLAGAVLDASPHSATVLALDGLDSLRSPALRDKIHRELVTCLKANSALTLLVGTRPAAAIELHAKLSGLLSESEAAQVEVNPFTDEELKSMAEAVPAIARRLQVGGPVQAMMSLPLMLQLSLDVATGEPARQVRDFMAAWWDRALVSRKNAEPTLKVLVTRMEAAKALALPEPLDLDKSHLSELQAAGLIERITSEGVASYRFSYNLLHDFAIYKYVLKDKPQLDLSEPLLYSAAYDLLLEDYWSREANHATFWKAASGVPNDSLQTSVIAQFAVSRANGASDFQELGSIPPLDRERFAKQILATLYCETARGAGLEWRYKFADLAIQWDLIDAGIHFVHQELVATKKCSDETIELATTLLAHATAGARARSLGWMIGRIGSFRPKESLSMLQQLAGAKSPGAETAVAHSTLSLNDLVKQDLVVAAELMALVFDQNVDDEEGHWFDGGAITKVLLAQDSEAAALAIAAAIRAWGRKLDNEGHSPSHAMAGPTGKLAITENTWSYYDHGEHGAKPEAVISAFRNWVKSTDPSEGPTALLQLDPWMVLNQVVQLAPSGVVYQAAWKVLSSHPNTTPSWALESLLEAFADIKSAFWPSLRGLVAVHGAVPNRRAWVENFLLTLSGKHAKELQDLVLSKLKVECIEDQDLRDRAAEIHAQDNPPKSIPLPSGPVLYEEDSPVPTLEDLPDWPAIKSALQERPELDSESARAVLKAIASLLAADVQPAAAEAIVDEALRKSIELKVQMGHAEEFDKNTWIGVDSWTYMAEVVCRGVKLWPHNTQLLALLTVCAQSPDPTVRYMIARFAIQGVDTQLGIVSSIYWQLCNDESLRVSTMAARQAWVLPSNTHLPRDYVMRAWQRHPFVERKQDDHLIALAARRWFYHGDVDFEPLMTDLAHPDSADGSGTFEAITAVRGSCGAGWNNYKVIDSQATRSRTMTWILHVCANSKGDAVHNIINQLYFASGAFKSGNDAEVIKAEFLPAFLDYWIPLLNTLVPRMKGGDDDHVLHMCNKHFTERPAPLLALAAAVARSTPSNDARGYHALSQHLPPIIERALVELVPQFHQQKIRFELEALVSKCYDMGMCKARDLHARVVDALH